MHANVLKIYVRLQGELKEHFLEIKRDCGLVKNAPVVRLLINEYWKRVLKGA